MTFYFSPEIFKNLLRDIRDTRDIRDKADMGL
jgi:hypothetical protein